MTQWLSIVDAIAIGVIVGHIGHELAHFAVLRVAGHDPSIVFDVPLSVAWDTPVPVPLSARLAAIAPAVVGAAVVVLTVAIYPVVPAALPVCLGAVCSLCMLSPADRDIALGRLAAQ